MRRLIFILLLFPVLAFAFPPLDSTAKLGREFKEDEPKFLKQEVRKFALADWQLNQNLQLQSAAPEFTQAYFDKFYQADPTEDKKCRDAEAMFADLERRNHYIDKISPDELTNLPVGLTYSDRASGKSISLGIQKAKLYPAYMELTIFCKIVLADGRALLLGADSVKLSRQGGFMGNPILTLLKDFQVPLDGGRWMLNFKGGMNPQTGEVKNTTYASFDCSGLKEINIAGDVLFPRDKILPVDDKYKIIENKNVKVKASFQTTVFANEFPNFILEISIPPFAEAQTKGFSVFVIDKAVLDLSDVRNSPSVQFPKDYKRLVPGRPELWKGFYVKRAKVIKPEEFKPDVRRFESDTITSLEATNILFDGEFSGRVDLVADLRLPIDEPGGDWDVSVNHLFINFEAGRFPDGGFGGWIKLPITGEADTLTYSASFGDFKNWNIRVETNTQVKVKIPMFMGEAQLDPNSYIEIKRLNGKWLPKAVLNGRMGIVVTKETKDDKAPADAKQPLTKIEGLEFQNLTLQTEKPYLQADYLGYKGEVKLAFLPAVLSDIGLKIQGETIALSTGVKVSLMDGKFFASGRIGIVSEKGKIGFEVSDVESGQSAADSTKATRAKYTFKKLDLGDGLAVDADFGTFELKGSYRLYTKDSVMGTGFQGSLGYYLKLSDGKKGPGFEAKAALGYKHDEHYGYGYIDILAAGIKVPIGATPFVITSAAFGLSYNMRREAQSAEGSDGSFMSAKYLPDNSFGLGLRGMVGVDIAAASPMKGELTLDMQWGKKSVMPVSVGLLGKIYVLPNADFLKNVGTLTNLAKQGQEVSKNIDAKKAVFDAATKNGNFDKAAQEVTPKEQGWDKKAIMTIVAGLTLDFVNGSLHSNFDIYTNFPGGMITGTASNGRTGWGQLHADKTGKWYIHLGNPTDRLGLRANLDNESYAELKAYFMAGHDLPAPASMNPVIADKLQEASFEQNRDLEALSTGKGFAFGADFSAKYANEVGAVAGPYYSVEGILGFDLMLKDYGNTASCKGGEGKIGWDGYYANGQAYLYAQGELGVYVNLLDLYKKRVPLLKGSLTAAAQVGFPDPVWADAIVKVEASAGICKKYSISGSAVCKISLGKKCELVNKDGSAYQQAVISGFSTDNLKEGEKADVMAMPQVTFNRDLNQILPSDDGKELRLTLKTFDLLYNGQSIAGKKTLLGTSATFESDEILPPNSTLDMIAEVVLEENRGGNWEQVYQNGQLVVERKTTHFATGEAPSTIPLQNIKYSYPVVGQKYFYPQEHIRIGLKQGYIQLKRGQAYLFADNKDTLVTELNAKAVGTESKKIPFRYDSTNKRVWFDLPLLETKQAYSCVLMRLPSGASAESNIKQETKVVETNAGSIEIIENKSEGLLSQNEPHIFLTYDFNTSEFNTFEEKMQKKEPKKYLYEIISSDVGALQANVYGNEMFDKAEAVGTEQTDGQALVQAEAVLTDSYFQQEINKLIYSDYQTTIRPAGFTIDRDTAKVGLVPVRAVELMDWYIDVLDQKGSYGFLEDRLPYRYNLVWYYNEDFSTLQNKIVTKYVSNPAAVPPVLYRFVESVFPNMQSGYYNTVFRYRLPGGEWGTKYSFEYKNNLN